MISVIIPVYNVEKYLERCLDSLIAQTWKDWQAICVDDGSVDSSAGILDTYSKRDSRFKVHHIKNGGAAHARNYALQFVEGEYLMLLDSDDFIHPQTMELCMYFASKDDSDLVTFTYHHPYRTITSIRQILHLPDPRPHFAQYNPETVERRVSDDVFEYATEFSKPKDIDRKWAIKHCHPVRCVYRVDRICDLRFVEGIIYEDFPWWSSVLLRTRRVTILTLPLYYYYPNFKGSILSSTNHYKIESLEKSIESAEAVYKEKATPYQYKMWTKNFLTPFKSKLEKKRKKLK